MKIEEAYKKNWLALGTITELLVTHSKYEIDDETFVKKVRKAMDKTVDERFEDLDTDLKNCMNCKHLEHDFYCTIKEKDVRYSSDSQMKACDAWRLK